MSLTKRVAKKLLESLPGEGKAVKDSVRGLMVQKELAVSKLSRALSGDRLPDPCTVYWIDPFSIEHRTSLQNGSFDSEDWVFKQHSAPKPVQAGDWDESSLLVSDLRVCRAVADRIKHGTEWQQSDYYKTALAEIEGGRVLWDCRRKADFDKRMDGLDRLIESIQQNGYTLRANGAAGSVSDTPLGHTEVLVNLGRSGAPLFQDGRHRLAIARALELKQIPVQVLVRHTEWLEFREFMHRMAAGNGGASKPGFLYQKPPHFDFADIPAEHGCTDRWEAMASHLPAGGGLALDIGANLGYFSHALDRAGFQTTAVEYYPEIALAAERLALAEKRSLRVVHGDILSPAIFEKIGSNRFSLVLAVNIFHHFIKTEAGFNKLRAFVQRLRSDVMFFEPHHPADPQMHTGFANPTPEEFTRMIVEWGGFKRHTSIYTAADGRTIFKLD